MMWAIEVKIGWQWYRQEERYHNKATARAVADDLTKQNGKGYRLVDLTTGNTFTV